jgi:hypothetical protein
VNHVDARLGPEGKAGVTYGYRRSQHPILSDAAYKAALTHFGERGIMDIIGIIGYYDLAQ